MEEKPTVQMDGSSSGDYGVGPQEAKTPPTIPIDDVLRQQQGGWSGAGRAPQYTPPPPPGYGPAPRPFTPPAQVTASQETGHSRQFSAMSASRGAVRIPLPTRSTKRTPITPPQLLTM